MLVLTLMLFGAEELAEITLRPNTTELLQRDNLLVTVVLENKSVAAITVFPVGGGQFRIEVREGNAWVTVGGPLGDGLPGGGLLLLGKSSFAEFGQLHRRKGGFLFENQGEYQLRAVARMPWGELASKAVTIKVGKRDTIDLERIADPQLRLAHLGYGVESPMPANILALESAGGNIGRTIKDRMMTRTLAMSEPWKGESVPHKDVCDWLSKKMDSVSYEHALSQLGVFYRQKKNWDGVFRVSQALVHDSVDRRECEYQLELLTKPPIPARP